jgi:cytochrome c553
VLAIFAANVPALAAPPPAGATACSGCHGAGGTVPSLKGLSAADIGAAMRAYRTGARPATVMDRIAKGFSDEEIEAMAVFLSSQR